MLRKQKIPGRHKLLPPAIIADDLSGAMDTGLQFAKRNLETWVALAEGDFGAVPTLVVSSESREAPDAEARRLVREAARFVRGRSLYKKMDSTLRGNPGLEIALLMREFGYEKAIVTPAFPEQQRIVQNGELYIGGRPLLRSEMARDLRWPLSSSRVEEVLVKGADVLCSHVELQKVQRGPWGLLRALDSHLASLIVVDAVTREHLDIIAGAVLLAEGTWLPCGSAGLAQSLAAQLSSETAPPYRPEHTDKPVLIVAGSRQKSTAAQIKRAEERLGVSVIRFVAARELEGQSENMDKALGYLQQKQSVILTTSPGSPIPGERGQVAQGLGQAARMLAERTELAGLVLTGGDIALAVCSALGTRAIHILDELEPGIPVGALQGGAAAGVNLITKAGGFGSPDVLVKAIHFLQGTRAPEPLQRPRLWGLIK